MPISNKEHLRSKWVMGNWKMNGSKDIINNLLQGIVSQLDIAEQSSCVVFPPSIYIPKVNQILSGHSEIKIGAQNIYPADAGAFTGELSADMLKDFGCQYVLVGHSERRQLFKEDEKFVAEKFHHAKVRGMIPVLCIGETLEERQNGLTEQVLLRQLTAVEQEKNAYKDCVIAYEPVWAIGTGQTAMPEQAQQVHAFIRAHVAQFDNQVAEQLTILYGGSVNDQNAQVLFSMPDVDGGLVGGASLKAQQFVEIVKCIN